MASSEKMLKVTQVKSGAGSPKDQRLTLEALGFKRVGQTRMIKDNPATRGMIFKIRHLLKTEEQ